MESAAYLLAWLNCRENQEKCPKMGFEGDKDPQGLTHPKTRWSQPPRRGQTHPEWLGWLSWEGQGGHD